MATSKLTVREFFDRFPTEEACLEHVMSVRYGLRHFCRKCGVEASFHRLEKRPAYSCAVCGNHVYPCAGTILQDTRTPLQMWFYAIYLFVVTRHGVSGKELERQLGVTYKTAYRIGHQIRALMCAVNGFDQLRGHVEMDEAFIGGQNAPKTVVVGMKERGGRMVAERAPDVTLNTLRLLALRHIEPGSTVSTDEHKGYNLLERDGYTHHTVKHSAKEYARRLPDGELVSVNEVESFWRVFKNSIRSTHIHVSSKHMHKYLGEFVFRSNRRAMRNAMFDLLIAAF
jgi:transposase-like protein